MGKVKRLGALIINVLFVFASCDLSVDDEKGTGGSEFDEVLSPLRGVWYSYDKGIGRTDGYRIGTMRDFTALMEDSGKAALFPALPRPPRTYNKTLFTMDDYFVFFDDTVYGEQEDGTGGNGGWDFFITRYMGVVRGINFFSEGKDRGAIIVEYFEGCAPQWDDDIKDGQRPFFGIYYRVHDSDTLYMANAVDLAALFAGKNYYTEQATLEKALALNTEENEAAFISWGVVMPQHRE
jgi:hypothetical protein